MMAKWIKYKQGKNLKIMGFDIYERYFLRILKGIYPELNADF